MEKKPSNDAPVDTGNSQAYHGNKNSSGILGKLDSIITKRTLSLFAVLALVIGTGAGLVAVQQSTEYRQQAAYIIPTQPPPPSNSPCQIPQHIVDKIRNTPGIQNSNIISGRIYYYGDVNMDRQVTSADAQIILKFDAGSYILNPLQIEAADVDGLPNYVSDKTSVNSVDALKILRFVSGIEKRLPVCGVEISPPPPTPTLVSSGSQIPPCYIPQFIVDKLKNAGDTQNIMWNRLFGYGDVDMDGRVTTKDSDLVQKFDVGLSTLNSLQLEAADVDGPPNTFSQKSNVTIIDAQKIRAYALGEKIQFPVCGVAPTPTCRPRPACLDANPPCYVTQTSNMCPATKTPTPTKATPIISPWSTTPVPAQ